MECRRLKETTHTVKLGEVSLGKVKQSQEPGREGNGDNVNEDKYENMAVPI